MRKGCIWMRSTSACIRFVIGRGIIIDYSNVRYEKDGVKEVFCSAKCMELNEALYY